MIRQQKNEILNNSTDKVPTKGRQKNLLFKEVEDRPVPITNNGLRIIPMDAMDMMSSIILLLWELKTI